MKALPSILAAIAAVIVAASVPLQALISHHPVLSGIIGTLAIIFAHLSPSPLTPTRRDASQREP